MCYQEVLEMGKNSLPFLSVSIIFHTVASRRELRLTVNLVVRFCDVASKKQKQDFQKIKYRLYRSFGVYKTIIKPVDGFRHNFLTMYTTWSRKAVVVAE